VAHKDTLSLICYAGDSIGAVRCGADASPIPSFVSVKYRNVIGLSEADRGFQGLARIRSAVNSVFSRLRRASAW
jgi:hypothetical protein